MDNDFWSQIKIPKQKKKQFFVTVEGKTVEVSLTRKLEVEKFGPHHWTWRDGELVPKPRPKPEGIKYAQLKDTDGGYELLDNNPFWPLARVKRGKDFTYE